MDRQTYFKRLTQLVSWRLPRAEAEEVLCDYQEMLFQRPVGGDRTLLQELGTPLQAARVLTDPKLYRRWLTMFAMMAACLVIPAFFLLRGTFYHYPLGSVCAVFALGMAACILWFRPRRKPEKKSFPKGLLPILLGSLAVSVAAGILAASIIAGSWASLPLNWYGPIVQGELCFLGAAAVVAGLLGLVKARISDRRWCALYVLELTVLAVSVLVTAVLHSLDLSGPTSNWWHPYAIHVGIIGAAGLAGTGVSLC